MNPSGILAPPYLRADIRYLKAAEWWATLAEEKRQSIFDEVEKVFPFCSEMIATYRRDWSIGKLDVRQAYALYRLCEGEK